MSYASVIMVCMHRVDTKRKQAAIIRTITYAVTLVLTVLTTAMLLYIALGYRIGSSGHVVKNGLLLVDNRPQSAMVYVNGVQKDPAPSRFVLPAGNYDVDLKLNGYRDWSKQVNVSASKVREVKYPLLLPKNLNLKTLKSLEKPDVVSQSKDRKQLLMYSEQLSQLSLVELDPKEAKVTNLQLGNSVVREGGSLGKLRVIEWSLNNKHVLIEQMLPSGAINYLSLETAKPAEAINITKLYGDNEITDLHYVGDNTDLVYGLKNGILSSYSLSGATQSIIMQRISQYTPYSDDTILYSKVIEDGLQQMGIRQGDKETVITQAAADLGKPILKYAGYDRHMYFVIGYDGGEIISVYRDPLAKPILAKQLPFTSFEFSKPTSITFSGSSEFFIAQNSSGATVYDFEDVKQHKDIMKFELATGSEITWVDDHHLQAVNKEGINFIFDYDGTNMQELTATKPGTELFYSDNFQHYYSLKDLDLKTDLNVTSLVVGKE